MSERISAPALAEDRLVDRLLGPAIHAGQTGEPPAPEVTARIAEQASGLREADPVRVYEVLTPALCGKRPQVAMQWLRDAGLLVELLPELDATVAFSQEGGRRHKDVWDHTKTVVFQAVPSPTVRWAAVLHDIGKVPTRRFLPGGKVTFHGHAEVGVRMFRRGPAKRIGFPADVKDRVEVLILHHLRPGQYDGSWTDAAVRRFAREMGPALDDLLNLGRADVTSRRPGKRRGCLRSISELAARIRSLQAEDARPRPLPPGLGKLLMDQLELPAGKHLAVLRDRLTALCLEGEIESGQDPGYYVDQVRARNLLDGVEVTRGRP